LDERPGQLLLLPRRCRLTSAQSHNHVADPHRLPGLERQITRNAIAFIEQPDDRDPLVHRGGPSGQHVFAPLAISFARGRGILADLGHLTRVVVRRLGRRWRISCGLAEIARLQRLRALPSGKNNKQRNADRSQRALHAASGLHAS
jgi:hypothetical protein